MNSYDIFISYRRIGGTEIARPLKSELEMRGFRVFLDFDELKDGKFDSRIMEAIDNSPVFMVILSEHSLDRCINEDDWVRKEIEYAIQKEKNIIPINPNFQFSDFPAELPKDLREGLGSHLFSDIMLGQLFKESVEKLVRERLAEYMNVTGSRKAEEVGAIIRIETDLDCELYRFGEKICIAKADEYTKIRLRKGKHKLEFRNLENPQDRLPLLFVVEDNEMEDFISVELNPIRNRRIEEERKAREAEERRIREEQERKEREDAERLKKIESERKAKEEKERKAREEEERKIRRESSEERKLYSLRYRQLLRPCISSNNGKGGYINGFTGEIVIPCIYDKVTRFIDNKAAVRLNGKWGFIDMAGKLIIPFIYDDVTIKDKNFGDRLFVRHHNEEWYGIDYNGDTYPSIGGITADFWTNNRNPERYPYKKEREANNAGLSYQRYYWQDRDSFKYGYYDEKLRDVIPCIYDSISYSFDHGLARVGRNGKYGFIDVNGAVQIPIEYDNAGYFTEYGMAKVGLNGKYGFIGTKGEIKIAMIYDELSSEFFDELSKARLNGKYGFIDKDGRTRIPFIYDNADVFRQGISIACSKGKYICIDIYGEEISPEYDSIKSHTYDTYGIYDHRYDYLYRVKLGEKWGFYDALHCKEIVAPEYDEVYPFNTKGLAEVKLNGKWGTIDTKGKIIKAFKKEIFSSRKSYDQLCHEDCKKYLECK